MFLWELTSVQLVRELRSSLIKWALPALRERVGSPAVTCDHWSLFHPQEYPASQSIDIYWAPIISQVVCQGLEVQPWNDQKGSLLSRNWHSSRGKKGQTIHQTMCDQHRIMTLDCWDVCAGDSWTRQGEGTTGHRPRWDQGMPTRLERPRGLVPGQAGSIQGPSWVAVWSELQ